MKLFNRRLFAPLGAVVLGALGVVFFRRRVSRGISREKLQPAAGPKAAKQVDIDRYMGKWYEIARYPNPSEQRCFGSAIEYTRRPDGKVVVLNYCRRGSFDAPLEANEGIAHVVNDGTNTRLSMESFWPFTGDYRIVDLDANYQYAVVSNDARTALWIFSRTPEMPEEMYLRLLNRLADQGFDVKRINKTPQPAREVAGVR